MIRKLGSSILISIPKTRKDIRWLSSTTQKVISLKYANYGEPQDVLQRCEEQIGCLQDEEIHVKVLLAPINPADINTIQGKYPVKPALPAIGGNEFVAEVLAVGKSVKDIQPGDHVIPFKTGLGAWRSEAIFNKNCLYKVPKSIGLVEAATFTVNPCTAYRMLKDFVKLKPGDTVIQNGANSAVGQAVHQLCKAWNIDSVGVVRDRPNIEELRCFLKELGATEVLTTEEIRKTDIFKKSLQKPILGLNCVGGKIATDTSRHLKKKGVFVTYGGMSREPVNVSTASLIFNDIAFRGFWMTRWTEENYDSPARIESFNELISLLECGKLKAPVHELVSINCFREAVKAALDFNGFTGKKFILDFRC